MTEHRTVQSAEVSRLLDRLWTRSQRRAMKKGALPPHYTTWHDLTVQVHSCGLATVAILSDQRGVLTVGWSKAMHEDKFDETVGQRIAIAHCFDAYHGVWSHAGQEDYRPHAQRPPGYMDDQVR